MRTALVSLAILSALLGGCAAARPGTRLARTGDEIVICGQLYHTGAPVVLWTDPGGYDAYRTERRFAPREQADWAPGAIKTPNRYNQRTAGLSDDEIERTRGGGWDLETLRRVVDQFVIHYDAAGTSRECFRVLQDHRGLSVHFMLDLDGTIYQTLDVKERAWHATTSNDRSVGVEIANIGAYPPGAASPLARWYGRDSAGRAVITIPSQLNGGGVRSPGQLRPARDEPVRGTIQGQTLEQYDLTPQQYESLERLTAALCTVLPEIRCDAPRAADGQILTNALAQDQLAAYSGILGHYHIQTNKTDPGPAFDWERLLAGARRLMGRAPGAHDRASSGSPPSPRS
jgi:N-acetylmuramoyl-L-alanine amidase